MDTTISLEEFKKTKEYASFIKENPNIGLLKVQVFIAQQALPVDKATIVVSKTIGGYNVIFFKGDTNSSGIIDDIELPAPKGDYNLETQSLPSHTDYDVTLTNDHFEGNEVYVVSMYGGVKIVQYIKASPKHLKQSVVIEDGK